MSLEMLCEGFKVAETRMVVFLKHPLGGERSMPTGVVTDVGEGYIALSTEDGGLFISVDNIAGFRSARAAES